MAIFWCLSLDKISSKHDFMRLKFSETLCCFSGVSQYQKPKAVSISLLSVIILIEGLLILIFAVSIARLRGLE